MTWWQRLRNRDRLEYELDAELRDHLERLAADYVAAGMAPDAARRKARLEFGGLDQVKEVCRDERGLGFVDDLSQDVRYALRGFGKAPGFAAIAISTLALGIGANSAIFSAVNAVLLRSLPYAHAEQFVRLFEEVDAENGAGTAVRPTGITKTELDELRARAKTVTDLGVFVPRTVTLDRRGETIRLSGIALSPALMEAFGAQPMIGRLLERREESAGLNRVLILSHGAWRRHFDSNPQILGTVVSLDGDQYSVVGVMPSSFQFPDAEAQFWTPFIWPAMARLIVSGRLADGASIRTASDEVTNILRQMRGGAAYATWPPPPPPPPPPGMAPKGMPPAPPPPSGAAAADPQTTARKPLRIRFVGFQQELVAPIKPALLVMTVAVAFVLLIGCANMAGLLLARGAARQRELAVRAALGAGRSRLIRQVLTESLVLALAGGAAGTALAFGGIRLLQSLGAVLPRRDLRPAFYPAFSLPRLSEIGLDISALQFTLGLSLLTGLIFGLLPALRLSRSDRTDLLPEPSGSAVGGFDLFRRHRIRGVLIVAEIALATVLFIGGGLLIHSFVKLSSVQPGYDPDNVLTFQVVVPQGGSTLALLDDLATRLRSLPGVTAVGYADKLPMSVGRGVVPLRKTPAPLAGPPPPPTPGGDNPPEFPDLRIVSRAYLDAMKIPIIQGRSLEHASASGSPRAMLINRTLARSGFLGADPIGAQIYGSDPAPWEVVGIVEDVRQLGLDVQPGSQVFIAYDDVPSAAGIVATSPPYFTVRTESDPRAFVSSIRAVVEQLDARAALDNVATMDQVISNSMVRPRLNTVIVATFAALAVLLAVIGIYGVVSFAVVQRTREIGVRVALGARRSQVLGLVMRQTMVVTAIGIAVGVAGGVAVTRYLSGMLFGVTPLDPLTFIAASTAFAAVAIVSALIPARRATMVDPMIALRSE